MGWPKGKKRGPKQPILDADNPPKKIRVINKKVIGNLKVLLMLVHPHFILIRAKNQILELLRRAINHWGMQKK